MTQSRPPRPSWHLVPRSQRHSAPSPRPIDRPPGARQGGDGRGEAGVCARHVAGVGAANRNGVSGAGCVGKSAARAPATKASTKVMAIIVFRMSPSLRLQDAPATSSGSKGSGRDGGIPDVRLVSRHAPPSGCGMRCERGLAAAAERALSTCGYVPRRRKSVASSMVMAAPSAWRRW